MKERGDQNREEETDKGRKIECEIGKVRESEKEKK